MVFNKVDLLGELQPPGIERDENGRPLRVWVSAHSGAGIDDLMQAISELLGEEAIETTLPLAPAQGRLRARFYQCGAVLEETTDEDGRTLLHLRLPRQDFVRLLQEAGMDPQQWLPSPPAAAATDPAEVAAENAVDTPPQGAEPLDEAV
jgi:GTP-binding protein HflX